MNVVEFTKETLKFIINYELVAKEVVLLMDAVQLATELEMHYTCKLELQCIIALLKALITQRRAR